MIRKLRKKFILINMVFVTSILITVLAFLFFTNARKFERDSRLSMWRAADEGRFNDSGKLEQGRRPGGPPANMAPLFVVSLNREGNIMNVQERNITVTSDQAKELVALVKKMGEEEGLVKSYALRYLVKRTPDGSMVVFADRSYEISALRSFLVNCLLIFAGGFAAFFVLSLYLSRWALRPVERAWQQQSQFIADASHELKTPLTVILANLGILVSHKQETIASQEKWLANTKEEAGRMRQLVENLLFLAKSDAREENTVVSKEMIDFSDLVWNRILSFESVAFEQHVTIEEEIAGGMEICGNRELLNRLVAILLDNACKYAGKNGRVMVKAEKEGEKLRLLVKNTGDPIPQEEIPHIFERFYRTDKSRVHREGGYGLGLAIARTIAEEHKGKIGVESSSENGTLFWVILPLC